MGKEIYLDKPTFRAYFGKCFDEILLGDRPYGLKQDTETQKQKVLHTFIKTTSETDPETKKSKTVHKIAGYYEDKDVSVKTGKLTEEQKLTLKQQFLQLAYDSVSKNMTNNKLYVDLTYNSYDKNALPIELHYKSIQNSGNVVVENDYNDKAKENWEKIAKTKNPMKTFSVNPEKMDMFYESGEQIGEYKGDFVYFKPNYKYRENVAKNLMLNWRTMREYAFGGKEVFSVDDYLNSLYKSVLDNMEKEDREIIEKELPNFGITEEEKELFLDRNEEFKEHLINLDPALAGNRYVEKIFPGTKKDVVFHAPELLEKYFSKTINAQTEKQAREEYKNELSVFVDKLLSDPKSGELEDVDIRRIRYEYSIDRKNITGEKEVNDFIKLVHDKVMPSLILSQDAKSVLPAKNKKEPIESINLNKMVCSPEVPREVKYTVSKVSAAVSDKAEKMKTIYDELIAPNIKNNSLDMKAMQQSWLKLSKQMNEPVKETDSEALKIIKSHKDFYKDLTVFNGETKEKGEEFKSNEMKIEWRNEEVMGIFKDAIDYYAPKEIKEQMDGSYRFGIKSADYRKLMHKQMRGREVAADALDRIKSLNERNVKNVDNPYKYLEKDEQGFLTVDENTRQDYLNRCCAEINALNESYNQRSFWYRIAFWRTKPEKNAIAEIENSLKRNGFSKEEIQNNLAELKDKTNTDGPFDYKTNNHLEEEKTDELDNFGRERITIDHLEEAQKDSSDLELEEGKKLVEQVLPKSHVKVVDPILGNVSEMYGVILNNEKEKLMDSYLLEEYAKEKSESPQTEKVYTEKDVEVWEDFGASLESQELDYEEMLGLVDDYDPEAENSEEEDLDNSMQVDEAQEVKE